jgi:hypothetical protein
VAFLLPNVIALFIPYEEFPYTSAPMFAHYVGDNTPVYRFRFIGEFQDERVAREIRAADLNMNGVPFSRYFFGSVYGSIDPLSPFGRYVSTTPAEFEQRLTTFFGSLTTVLKKQSQAEWPLSRIRLEVVRLNRENRDSIIHTVGYYDVASDHFSHTWRNKL